MAVIINDFEIAVEPPQPAAPGTPPPPAAAVPPSPQEIVAIVEWQRARLARVHAT